MIRKATISDLNRIDLTARSEVEALGFVPRVVIQQAILQEWLNYHEESGSFVLFRERKDGVTTVQYICVPFRYRGKGIGKALIASLSRPIMLKCPAFIESNDFYRAMGFKHQGFEQNKKRPVNIWRLDDDE